MRSQRTSNILLATAAVLAASAVAEIALRLVAPVANPYEQTERLRPRVNQYIRFEYPPHYRAVTEAESGLPGLSGINRFTTNNMGFRGDSLAVPKPKNEFRIFLIGGSATECFYLDDENDMSRILQRELAARAPEGIVVRAYNAGMSGAASDDHIAMLSQRIVHLEPDLVVVFAGINDLIRSIYGVNRLHFTEPRGTVGKPWYKRMPMHLQIVRRLFYLKLRIRPEAERLQEQRSLATDYARLVALQRAAPPSDASPRTDETSYAQNLRSIAGIARANGIPLAFITQQTTWNSTVDPKARAWQWMRYRAGVTWREDLMDSALERLNDVTRSVGAAEGVPVFDLVRAIPKSLEYFYDDCHFNNAGASAAGRGLAEFLIEQRLAPSANPPGRERSH